MIETRSAMGWTEHVASIGDIVNIHRILVVMGVYNFIDPVMDDRILLIQIFKTRDVKVKNEYT
jgi:predicted small integral membrane protein